MLKSPREIEIMAEAGRRLARILRTLASETREGATPRFLDDRSRALIKEAESRPAFLNYKPAGSTKPFPAALCVSVNDVIVHGVPSDDAFKKGDIVKLDLGLVYGGFYADAALTIGIGDISPEAQKLIKTAEQALRGGIEQARAGKTLGDIGWAIERLVHSRGFSVVESLSGHGIGKELHEEPSVLNVGQKGKGRKLGVGMVIAIEPMISAGSSGIIQRKDDSFATKDGSLSAHFEHTVAITEHGPRILTEI